MEDDMSQEEHILHTLKEMKEWTAHADRQMSRIKWSLYGLTLLSLITIALVLSR